MVWIFSPPGVSSACANSRRAEAIRAASGARSPVRRINSARSAASSASAQPPSCALSRVVISAAAALV